MKTPYRFPAAHCGGTPRLAVRPVFLAVTAAMMLAIIGCVAHKPRGLVKSLGPLPEAPRLELGTIAVVCAPNPAAFGFDKAKGQMEDCAESAGELAGKVLVTPEIEPHLQAALSVMLVGAAPFAAAAGALGARQKLAPETLAICESNLVQAMRTIAAQDSFRSAFLRAAPESTWRRLVPADSWQMAVSEPVRADAVLETEVRQVRLERTGGGDASFVLVIQTRTRLVRAADAEVLFDEPAEFRTPACLFLHWTRPHAFEGVAATAYDKLARQALDALFVTTPDGPVLAGGGYNKPALKRHNASPLLAANVVRASTHPELVAAAVPAEGTIDVYAVAPSFDVTMQRPLTREEACSEAARELTHDMDGLPYHPNMVVSMTAFAAALPIGLWKQGAAVIRGLSPKHLNDADRLLTAAARENRPHEELASAVAHRLAPEAAQRVMLVRKVSPAGADPEFVRTECLPQGAQPRFVCYEKAVNPLQTPSADATLVIHVISAALEGNGGINPELALNINAEAHWLRAGDGHEIYSCPVRYRSEAHRYTKWAANDAQLFRTELRRCYDELGAGVVRQLVSHRLVTPGREPQPVLAAK